MTKQQQARALDILSRVAKESGSKFQHGREARAFLEDLKSEVKPKKKR